MLKRRSGPMSTPERRLRIRCRRCRSPSLASPSPPLERFLGEAVLIGKKKKTTVSFFFFLFFFRVRLLSTWLALSAIVSHKKGTTSYMSPKYFDTSANVAWLPLYRDIKIYSAIMKNLYGRANILMGNKINLGHV